ncbi:MAG: hypothetical protein OHK0046_39090 [Anaerolineae bacterium]
MLTLNAITLLFNGLTLALASGFLIIILWNDSRKQLHQFFAIFLFFVGLWNVGSLFVQASLLVSDMPELVSLAVSIMEMGFTGASVAVYILVTVAVGVHSRRFRVLAFASLFLIVTYRLFFIVNQGQVIPGDSANDILAYRLQPLLLIFYLLFDGVTLFVVWRFRRKMRSRGLWIGIITFVLGQSLVFVNPALLVASFATSISNIGVLLISFAILHQEIIKPLSERVSQVEAMHRVSLAISSQLAIDTVLNEIAVQAAGWLRADGVGIFLSDRIRRTMAHNTLKLVSVYNLPKEFLNVEIPFGQGVAGSTAAAQKTLYIENYQRDWHEADDFGLARETFGALICAPLIYANDILGVLMVVAGQQGRLFDGQDVYLLELLAAQAAVAIAHSHLFREQQQLMIQVEASRIQLETVLTSTENPVIAVDRDMRLIFANPAVTSLFDLKIGQVVTEILPLQVFPKNLRSALREIHQKGSFIYEVNLNQRVFLSHLATLGHDRVEGWVAVLHDITELKELDRLKSEMVRMASHDLKNPLMGAMAYLDLLGEDIQPFANAEIAHSLKTIEWQLERMHRIIGGILDLDKLTDAPLQFALCAPQKLVDDAVAEMEQFSSDKGIQLQAYIENDLPEVLVDREQLKRVLINLLENAIKFTLSGGLVEIRAYREEKTVIFAVKDNGVGIPEDVQARVFDRFFRGQQKGVEHVTGTGLGLSLVKTIVENHKGKVRFESQVNQGTTFYVCLTVANEAVNGSMFSYSQ